MTSNQPIRPYALAAGTALGLYVLLNFVIYWFWVRPDTNLAAPPAAAGAAARAPAVPVAPDPQAAQIVQSSAFALVPGSGDWAQEGDAILQRSTQQADLFAGSNLGGSQFTASVDVLWPAQGDGQLGGGLVFHMPSAGELAGAQMVRFHRNGQEVFWGCFNDQGAFKGEGSAALALAADKPHTLAVVVNETTFDILVDGEVVATERPLHRQSGILGLITYGGPITFTHLQTDAGGATAPVTQ